MHHPVGIRSLAVSFPSIRRTNDYYREKYPELIKEAEQKSLAKLFSPSRSDASNAFDREMLPYLSDPFRGTVERRVLDPRETSLDLEYRAARDALDAARLCADEVDLMLVATTFPEQIMPGNAVFLADQLGLRGAAWNLESTGASALVALQNACALIRAEEYRNVLVVISTTYSRLTDADDTLSWFTGDGAGAFVVSSLKPTQGTLGTKIVHTAKTCGAFYSELTKDQNGNPRMFLRIGKNANEIISDTSTEFLHTCCKGAAAAANVTFDQIDFFAFNTPTAWYSRFCIQALGIDPERTINIHPQYANIGAVFPIANLYYGAQLGRIRENDLVLVYAFGASANAAATVMRWSEVALGPVSSLKEPDLSVRNLEDKLPNLC